MNFDLENKIKYILKIEKTILDVEYTDAEKKYISPESYLWIKHTKWPVQTYKLLSKVTGINAFPDKNYKHWIEVFKNKGKGIKKRIGLFFKVPFESVTYLPINADFYFNKDFFGILLYINHKQPRVVKFNQIDDLDSFKKIQNEALSLKAINMIAHETVKTPKMISMGVEQGICFFEQEIVFARDLHSLSENKLRVVYDKVFDFMYRLYVQKGVSLVSPEKGSDTIHKAVEDFLNTIENGKEIINKYNKLIAEDKKMFVGNIHGDLWLNNILIDENKNKIWIIDWGESNMDYLAKDFRNNPVSAQSLYLRLVEYYKLDVHDIYSLEKQLFIAEFSTITQLISNHIVKRRQDSYFKSKVHACINRIDKLNNR